MKRMKKIMETAALIAILLWVISLIPFSRKIEQEIQAAIYQNGAAIGSTSVFISGKRTKHLLWALPYENFIFRNAWKSRFFRVISIWEEIFMATAVGV